MTLKLKAGDWVEVCSKEEILATLDERGRLDGMPFMPEMLAFCGKRYRVASSAHKTCDPAHNPWSIRGISDAVHLEGLRCDGAAHGGCQAGCLIFWKNAWLKRIEPQFVSTDKIQFGEVRSKAHSSIYTVDSLLAASAKPDIDGETVYTCQATTIRDYTSTMSPWNPLQYIRDLTSRNLHANLADSTWVGRLLEYILATIKLVHGLVLGIFIGRMGFTFYPAIHGTLDKTPTESLDLQPGELVEVKSIKEIVATLNKENRNRGLLFDVEMTPYCGGIYRVLRRVNHIINENTGKMMNMKFPCIVLEGVVCKSDYHRLCPRAIYSYWRENWLRRVTPALSGLPAVASSEADECIQSGVSCTTDEVPVQG